MKEKLKLNLQMFAEEAPAAESAPTAESTQTTQEAQAGVTAAIPARHGRKENPLANVQFGRRPAEEEAAALQSTEQKTERIPFEQLIKGEYKEDFHNSVQGIMQERFKKNAAMQKQVDAMMPMLMSLGQRYGVDMAELNEGSIKALSDAVAADDDHLEKEAMAHGMSKEGYKLMLDLQNREKILNERERRSQEQQNFENHINRLTQQATAIGIDLRQEMMNPEFVRLTSPGVNVPVEMAYRLVHQDEILKGGMQYAAQQGAQKVAAAVQAGKSRTVENGMKRKGANVIYKEDPTKLTKEEREELKRRVRAGDTSIVF